MIAWTQALREGAWAGSLASLLSAAVLLAAGQRREREAAGPVNAISHWVWGDAALRQDGASLRHTALGYAIHHAASLFWAALHMQALRRWPQPPRAHAVLAQSALTAATACVVDFRCTPRRFTPGFEHRLGRSELVAVYACFGLGLALGTALAGPLKRR